MAKIEVQFMTLNGTFAHAHKRTYDDAQAAFVAVRAYAEHGGYTKVAEHDNDGDGVRYTARTPGGRGGRNVAFGTFDVDWYDRCEVDGE